MPKLAPHFIPHHYPSNQLMSCMDRRLVEAAGHSHAVELKHSMFLLSLWKNVTVYSAIFSMFVHSPLWGEKAFCIRVVEGRVKCALAVSPLSDNSLWNKYLYTIPVSYNNSRSSCSCVQITVILCMKVLLKQIMSLCKQHITRWHQSARLYYWEQISHPLIYHLFSRTKGQRSVHLHCSSPQIPRRHSIHLERKTNKQLD